MATRTEQWYACEVCGELRRFPFDEHMDDPGCRCAPADTGRAGTGEQCGCGKKRRGEPVTARERPCPASEAR